ncbi:ATP-binding protein [Terriglobus albidus]|uniref:histidine kinase n=1 Tax=Terriglobus albidus TaxID=1592106 RepID=A0A5B9EKQ0_9BACT|nr:ATP-binding protein [Terriglobus albidus]QEE30656.1 ATP-binding protein [Terriglobus albidus]
MIAQRRAEQVEIRIADDGVGLPPEWSLETCEGLGLSVTRERITTLHNGASSFSVTRRPTGGTEVEIVLPLRSVDGNERGNG